MCMILVSVFVPQGLSGMLSACVFFQIWVFNLKLWPACAKIIAYSAAVAEASEQEFTEFTRSSMNRTESWVDLFLDSIGNKLPEEPRTLTHAHA